MSPRVLVLDTAEDVARHVAGRFLDLLRRPCVLGLATGDTTLPIYAGLVEAHRANGVSFRHATTFNLDEYAGLSRGHPASFARFMREALLSHVDIDPGRVHLLDGAAPDPTAEAERYERAIRAAGGIDLQLLGIGANGHIGFNEPGSALNSRTRCVTLEPSTRDANRHAFPGGERVPGQALTMGIGTILEAREIVLAATGAAKASAIACAVDGPVTPDCPASALQAHPAATIICDRAAAAGLHPRWNGAPCATS